MPYRIAILGIYHESNTFIRTLTSLHDFKSNCWLIGNQLREVFAGGHHEISGMFEILDNEDVEILPVFFSNAIPGGVIDTGACDTIVNEMFNLLVKALPVDACIVVPHGAAVAETHKDFDGYWLTKLRNLLGTQVPIAGTLDPHANISNLMIKATDCLIAYKTNPHIDQRETGKKAAALLMDVLNKKVKPLQYLDQLPMAISIEQQQSNAEPCSSLLEMIKREEETPGVLSISLLLGFPYADVQEMGTSILVITDNNQLLAEQISKRIAGYINKNIQLFNGEKIKIEEVVHSLHNVAKPILLLDMGDNIGGGSGGDSIYLLQKLADYSLFRFFFCLCDKNSVEMAIRYSPGETIDVRLAGEYEIKLKLLKAVDGIFKEEDPRHGGQKYFNMGKTVVFEAPGGSIIMVTSERVLPFSLQQLLAFDIDPQGFDVIVAKGVNAPIAAYAEVCPTIIKLDTPGVTQADMTAFEYKYRRKPMFPFEPVII